MWLLESDGDVLEEKRIWLRPGKTYLFGRTHSRVDGVGKGFKIEHSTISRKHATITVELPKPGDVSSLSARSGLKIEDLDSKHGVYVGERKLSNESLFLRGDEHVFRLGGFEQTFRIRWHVVVFTFKPSSRDKDKKLLQEKRALLEPLDIKAIDRFDVKETTHVVSNKRNTPQTLQALVHAKYIVDESILKELGYVTTEANLDEPESMSKLEVDFDSGWPDALKFLPAVNREPNPRPGEYFNPDASRNRVFRGYTFVMFDKKQYDGIQPAVVGGGGRAKLHELKLGQATAADIIRCMREEFDAAESLEEGSGYGVLHVRLVVTDPTFEEWATRIQTESVNATGQGLVEQNEFLDAILLKDARTMIKKAATQAESLVSVNTRIRSAPQSAPPEVRTISQDSRQARSQMQRSAQASDHNKNVQSEAEPPSRLSEPDDPPNPNSEPVEPSGSTTAPGRSRRSRKIAPAASAWKGFVDDTMGPDISFAGVPENEPEHRQASTPEPAQTTDIDDSLMAELVPGALQTPRKRPIPPNEGTPEDINAKLYPAQAAAKRRRLEAGRTQQQNVSPGIENEVVETEKQTRKVNAEADYEARIRKIREEQEKIKDEDLEPMHEQLEKMSFGERQRLVKIAEFEIKPRNQKLSDPQRKDLRWKEEWNDRKNFKGFRKKGQPAAPRNGSKIIIALEPIKTVSATEEYLANRRTEAERRRAAQRKEMDEKEEQDDEDDPSEVYTDANTHLEAAPAELLGDGGPEVVDVDAPRTTRASDKGSQIAGRTRTTGPSLKRQASTTPAGSVKKSKRLNLRNGDEDLSSEEDGIPSFRFRKK